MLNAVAGVWPVDEGSILIDGVDVTRLPEHKRAKFIGRVFQDPMTGTAATMQIEENLALAKRRGKTRTLQSGHHQGRSGRITRSCCRSLDLGLEDRLTAKVGLLSGGQRQALTLADGNAAEAAGCCCWTSTPPRWTPRPRPRCWSATEKHCRARSA